MNVPKYTSKPWIERFIWRFQQKQVIKVLLDGVVTDNYITNICENSFDLQNNDLKERIHCIENP